MGARFVAKVMNREPLPNVQGLDNLELQPEVTIGEVLNNVIPINLTERGGGYGKVAIFINGKEVINDARGSQLDPNLSAQTIYYSVENHPYLKKGRNIIEVKASSEDGFVQGKGVSIVLQNEDIESVEPSFYGVIIGVGEYANASINLKFPPQDAKAITTAITLGAENLFGKEKTHIYTISSLENLKPTKNAIAQVFEEISTTANAEDVIFVYLSGHGITWGGEQADFYFLTSDAVSADKNAYSDSILRRNNAISTNEFVSYLKKVAALKQVMIIDACGSGKAIDNLIAARDIDASQIKAIDRMKDRTGMFIISGCAADAVSYEASEYGQGLLTYAVLEAIRGPGLEQDRVDVFKIMNYSRDKVPELASGIGGIQKPQMLMPKGGSFDIGILNVGDREKIPLAAPKIIFVQSTFLNTDLIADNLALSDAVDKFLDAESSKKRFNLLFLDGKSYPNSCKINGTYTNKSNEIIANINIICSDNVEERFEITASNVSDFIEKINVILANK